MSEPAPVIAVDGPSGAGKGTLCQLLAHRLGWHFLDSGALYRLLALGALQAATDPDDGDAVAALAWRLTIDFQVTPPEPGGVPPAPTIRLDGRDVSEAIRDEAVSQAASRIAALQAVRDALRERQRAFRRPPGLVADGRDMGTVVFPDAELKIFLTASAEERARRRHAQLREAGADASLSSLLASIRERDERDRQRAVAPLEPAADAVVVDSTAMDIDAVLARVEAEARARGLMEPAAR